MFKKITVLAMAVGIVAAFALPASAGAAWKHKGQAIEQSVSLGLTGKAAFTGTIGGVECQVTSAARFDPGTTGLIQTFVAHPTDATTNCKGIGGLAACQIHNLTPTGLAPHGAGWVIHTSQKAGQSNTIEITVGDIHSTPTGGFCPLEFITLTGATILAHGEETPRVTNLSLSGSMQADLQTKGSPFQNNPHLRNGVVDKDSVTVHGTVQIEDVAQRDTYEI